jgi:hypothetical protein
MKYLKTLFTATIIIIVNATFTGCKKNDVIIPPKESPSAEPFSGTFGGDKDDYFFSIVKTADGGYVMAGSALSGNGSGDIPLTPPVGGNLDMMIVKTDSDGKKQWVATVGGEKDEYARSIVVCPDGSGYMIAGYSASNNSGDIPSTHGGYDMMIVKLAIDGKKQWVKTYGGNGSDEAHAIAASPDGNNYVIAGSTTTNNNGDIPPIHQKLFSFFSEVIAFSIQPDGTLQWIKNYGGNMGEDVRSIAVSPDGSGYVLAGYTSSDSSGDIPDTHNGTTGFSDMLVIKLGTDGTKQWVKTLGGNSFDFATCVAASLDGSGYLIAGMTDTNNNGDIPVSQGADDIVLFKLDAGGNKQWLRMYGGNDIDDAFSIAAIPGGDFVIAGFTASNNSGDIPANHAAGISSMDLLAGRFAPDGSKRWIKTYGGDKNDQGVSVTYNADGSFAIGGYTESKNSFDVLSNHGIAGSNDGWLIKVKDR